MNTDRRVGSTNISPAFVEHESGEGDTRGNMTSGKKFEREWLDSLTQKKQEKRYHTSTTARVPCNTYFVIDSKDRFQTSSSKNTVDPTTQNEWNNFVLQKPQNMSSVFPNRISVTEIMFPWQIPNIVTGLNDTLYLYIQPKIDAANSSNSANWQITIPGSAFYTPVELTAEINDAIDAQVTKNGLIANFYFQLEYNLDEESFSWISPGPDTENVIIVSPFPMGFAITAQDVANYAPTYFSQPSLLRTLGFNWSQVSMLYSPSTTIKNSGNPTKCAYTNYVDIISTKLNFYSEKDTTSSQDGAVNNLLCRIYCASETSENFTDLSGIVVPTPCRPFTIYRQFKTPKNIRWDNEATIDWIDIQVLDEYGNNVVLPDAFGPVGNTIVPPMRIPYSVVRKFAGSYQDFQITLLASEE